LPFLLDAANRLERLDDGQAREAYLEAIGAAVFAGRLDVRGGPREVAEAARAAPRGSQPPRRVDALLDGLATRFTDGYVGSAALLKRALQAFRRDAEHNEDDIMRWLWLTWLVAADMWEDGTWHELTTNALRAAREVGALNFLPLALTYRAAVHVYAGEFDVASALIEESDAITEATGNAPLKHSSLLLVAWRGQDAQGAALIQANGRWATTWGEGRAIGSSDHLSAVLYNGLGRYHDALARAGRALAHEDLGIFGFSLVELVEAGVRGGAPETALAALRRLEERTTASGTDWALGVLARSSALLTNGRAADLLYREAIERLGRTRIAVDLARAHLVYGEWLRRENRRRDACEQLRTAHEMLSGFGAEAFAERARRELTAAGESVRHRAVDARRVLTAQEAQIARRAADGKTNSEIGAELFISPRTVEWHMHKVFTKLDVDSRDKLRGALAGT
jgi:DNA-binding CsgD family transcriptional regulator